MLVCCTLLNEAELDGIHVYFFIWLLLPLALNPGNVVSCGFFPGVQRFLLLLESVRCNSTSDPSWSLEFYVIAGKRSRLNNDTLFDIVYDDVAGSDHGNKIDAIGYVILITILAALTCFTERPLGWCSSWHYCLRCCCSSSTSSPSRVERGCSAKLRLSPCVRSVCYDRQHFHQRQLADVGGESALACCRPRVDIAEIIMWSNCSCRASHVELTQFTIFVRYQLWCLFSPCFDSVRWVSLLTRAWVRVR